MNLNIGLFSFVLITDKDVQTQGKLFMRTIFAGIIGVAVMVLTMSYPRTQTVKTNQQASCPFYQCLNKYGTNLLLDCCIGSIKTLDNSSLCSYTKGFFTLNHKGFVWQYSVQRSIPETATKPRSVSWKKWNGCKKKILGLVKDQLLKKWNAGTKKSSPCPHTLPLRFIVYILTTLKTSLENK